MKFSSNPNTNVQQVLQPLFQNKHHSFCWLLFFKEYLNRQVRINKNGKQSANTCFHISIDYITFSSNIIVELFLKAVFPPLLVETFKLMVIRLLENTFANQKLESTDFYHDPLANLSPRFLSSPARQEM